MDKIRIFPNTACYASISSPIGKLTAVVSNAGLHGLLWEHETTLPTHQHLLSTLSENKMHPLFLKAKTQLTEYFSGKRHTFDLPLILNGTDFQIRCWQQLQTIKYGSTISYGEQAQCLGNKNKARAVGMANHVNPIPIIIPCHRVVGSRGQLTGFAAGLERKQYLLALEQRYKL